MAAARRVSHEPSPCPRQPTEGAAHTPGTTRLLRGISHSWAETCHTSDELDDNCGKASSVDWWFVSYSRRRMACSLNVVVSWLSRASKKEGDTLTHEHFMIHSRQDVSCAQGQQAQSSHSIGIYAVL